MERLTDKELRIQGIIHDRIVKAAEDAKEELKKKATYKIQLWFQSQRSMYGNLNAFSLSFWESGMRLHGGGDEMMFVCRRHADAHKLKPFDVVGPDSIAGIRGCDGLIPGGLAQLNNWVVCPHCQTKHRTEDIGDSIFYRTSMQRAADILAKWWRKLGCNADIYVKYCPTDPRVILQSKTMTPRKARELKGLTIYPLERIITDTVHGATVESRFKALLTA